MESLGLVSASRGWGLEEFSFSPLVSCQLQGAGGGVCSDPDSQLWGLARVLLDSGGWRGAKGLSCWHGYLGRLLGVFQSQGWQLGEEPGSCVTDVTQHLLSPALKCRPPPPPSL